MRCNNPTSRLLKVHYYSFYAIISEYKQKVQAKYECLFCICNSSAFRLPCYEIRPFRVLPTAKGQIPCGIYILVRALQQVQSPGLNCYLYLFVSFPPYFHFL